MNNPFVSRIGGILSADIAVPDHEREVRFYSRVLGTGENPLWRDDLMNNQGAPIIGLGIRTPEYESLPLQWMPHIQVADVAASVECALELGGQALMHGKDDDGNSLWAALFDPNGAAFGIMPVVPAEMLPPADSSGSGSEPARVGCIAWFDLTVADAAAAREFYRQVVGWSVQDVSMSDAGEQYADFNMLGEDGQPAAGVCHARGANHDLPPVWMMYLPVGDLAVSVRRVPLEGGKIIKDASAGEGFAYAVVQDPVGVTFGLVSG